MIRHARPLLLHAGLAALTVAALGGVGWAENLCYFGLLTGTAIFSVCALSPDDVLRRTLEAAGPQPAILMLALRICQVWYIGFAAIMGWFWLAAFFGVAFWIVWIRHHLVREQMSAAPSHSL